MVHTAVPAIAVFAIFLVINSGIAFFCWTVIRRHWYRLGDPKPSRPEIELFLFNFVHMASSQSHVTPYRHMTERERSMFTLMVMWLPFLGFTGGSLFWFYMTLEAIIEMIVRWMH
jgi:hypothetical protein